VRDPLPSDDDSRLKVLFIPAVKPLADEGFSDAVMRRVARHVWRRRLLLATAAVSGCAVAIQPAWRFASLLGEQLASLGSRWPEIAWLLESPFALVAGLLLIIGPGLVQWLEE
jgi:hypothetical protein